MTAEPIKDKAMVGYCMNYLKRNNYRDMVIFAIGVYTGLRISDILELRVGDIYKKNKLNIRQKKTGKRVSIDINKPLTRNQAYKILNKMGRTLGLGRIGPHTLRKTAGYHIFKATKNLELVMQILG